MSSHNIFLVEKKRVGGLCYSKKEKKEEQSKGASAAVRERAGSRSRMERRAK